MVLAGPPAETAGSGLRFPRGARAVPQCARADRTLRMRRGFARQVRGGEVQSGEGVSLRGERAAARARTRGRGPGGERPARGQGGAGVPERTPGRRAPSRGSRWEERREVAALRGRGAGGRAGEVGSEEDSAASLLLTPRLPANASSA